MKDPPKRREVHVYATGSTFLMQMAEHGVWLYSAIQSGLEIARQVPDKI
jgi:hypothetical protein